MRSLSEAEREVIISWTEADEVAQVYVTSAAMAKALISRGWKGTQDEFGEWHFEIDIPRLGRNGLLVGGKKVFSGGWLPGHHPARKMSGGAVLPGPNAQDFDSVNDHGPRKGAP
jgi:hypothetical protein